MAKGDFNLDNQEYDVVYDETKKKKLFSKGKKKTDNNIIDDSSDLGDFAISDYKYDEESNVDTFEQIKNFVKNINPRTLVVVFGIVLISFVAIFMVTLTIVKSNKSYTADIIIPDVLYMNEVSGVSITSKYIGKSIPKKDVTETVSTFEVKDNNIISSVAEKAIGSHVANAIIPLQEGRTTLEVESKLNNRVLAKSKKEVVVCPEFNSDFLLVKHVSIVKNSTYRLNMDFLDEECAKGITYESSNDDIAIIDENGAVTGFNVGSAVLTIKKGNKSITLDVDVTEKYVNVESFKILTPKLQLSTGENYRLAIDYSPANATSFTTGFYSSDDSVVRVSKNGLVEAISPGVATIKVSGASFDSNDEVQVVVTDKKQSSTFATSMILDNDKITLVQGTSKKIKAILTPDSVDSKFIKWKSSDDNVAYVTSNGVIYARNAGTATIEASTDNGLLREIKVVVKRIKPPVITASDDIATDKWHNKSYVLNFSGAKNGSVYYGDTDENSFNSDKLVISRDELRTYYIRNCTRICSEECSESVDNGKESSKKCDIKCAEKPFICSEPTNYVSKFDSTKPYIESVTSVEDLSDESETVQISIHDNISMVEKWCVTNKNDFIYCKWNTIKPDINPKLNFVSYKNGTYYVFAKDVAGNISDGYKFEIDNIK